MKLEQSLTSSDELLCNRSGDVLHLTLNRPERSNALSATLVEALIAGFETAVESGARLVTLRGSGAHFCAGLDLSNLANLNDEVLTYRLIRIETLLQLIAYAPHLTLVHAHGKTVGAGVDMVAAASHRVVAHETVMWMPGWQFDLALGTHRLLRRVGQSVALDYLIDGRRISAEQALQAGLVTEIAPLETFGEISAGFLKRALKMNPQAFKSLVTILGQGMPDQDMALLVRSVSKPGVKERIQAYIAQSSGAQKIE